MLLKNQLTLPTLLEMGMLRQLSCNTVSDAGTIAIHGLTGEDTQSRVSNDKGVLPLISGSGWRWQCSGVGVPVGRTPAGLADDRVGS